MDHSPSAATGAAMDRVQGNGNPFLQFGRSMQSLTANILSGRPNRTASSSSSSVRNQGTSSQAPTPAPSTALGSLSSSRLSCSSGGGGAAFVGQVFSMIDPSGNGLMAVTTHFGLPFLSKRTPEWIKKMLAMVTKSEDNGPVFRFFMDLNDAVAYIKRLNVPTGMVGACRLDVAYEYFKEKPHMFQFVPNEKQVKAANKLLKTIPQRNGRRKVDGVPVFTAQNLNIAIATNDGIKWYTPYFFDKNLLDNILEASIDQHFHTLIQNRHMQRRKDVFDDSLTAEVVEENVDSLFDPPEIQEVLGEMGHPDIPLSVISKAAEIKLLDVVDNTLLGNKWLRKATGIQPKFPYLVDSFEERSAVAFRKGALSVGSAAYNEDADNNRHELQQLGASDMNLTEDPQGAQNRSVSPPNFHFPLGGWFPIPWPRPDGIKQQQVNPLLPKITMVGISTGEGNQLSKARLKQTMEDLTTELEQASEKSLKLGELKDPLFVANVGDYSTITTRMNSA